MRVGGECAGKSLFLQMFDLYITIGNPPRLISCIRLPCRYQNSKVKIPPLPLPPTQSPGSSSRRRSTSIRAMSPVTSELFFSVLLLGLLATVLAGNATGVVNGCQNGEWDPSVATWENENMSGSLEVWWRETTGNGTKEKNFSYEIGKIGDAVLSLACGINTHDQCVNPSCDGEFFLYTSEKFAITY